MQANLDLANYDNLTKELASKIREAIPPESVPEATLKGTVRKIRTNLKGDFGLIRSAQLAPFVECDVRITVERILCPVCQHPMRDGKCPEHGRADKQEVRS